MKLVLEKYMWVDELSTGPKRIFCPLPTTHNIVEVSP